MPKLSRSCPNEQRFLDRIRRELDEAGWELVIRPGKRLRYFGVTGTCDADSKTIEVARNGRGWFKVLVHEFAHFQQQQEGLWADAAAGRRLQAFDRWVLGNAPRMPQNRIDDATQDLQACELDAEQRAIRWARRYDFAGWDLPKYIQEANAYVLSYEAVRQIGSWWKKAPFRSPAVMKVCSSRWLRRYDRLPRGYLDAFRRDCY